MMEDKTARSLRFMRFGLIVVVATAFATSFGAFYLILGPISTSFLDIITWPVIITVVTAVTSYGVYYFYKSYMAKGG